ncbi:MAG: DUF2924 domain-containing protein [Candidatus Omnitrophica bacterium]|nr:DUF2924 domain-containing protein [Candidatus Omnitrophota bacterium]
MKMNATESPKKPLIERIMALKEASIASLRAQHDALYGPKTPCSNNKIFLWRKIAYRLQELEYGGLPDDTKSRINELIKRYDPVNNKALRPKKTTGHNATNGRDTRLPIPGAIIRKEYKGQTLEVKVLENGFEYQSRVYKTLSAVAKAVTGDHWNGFLFFKP